jgi:hypothetical protein
MGEWLTRVLIYAESAWTLVAALLAVPVVVPLARVIHRFWVRPIIQVRLDHQADCHGRTPLVSLQDGKVVAQVMYLRLRIQNRGRTTIKDCLGNWVRIRVWSGGKVFDFAHEVISRGWAHHPESKQRNIPRGEAYYLDVATLLLSEDKKHNRLGGPIPSRQLT